MIEAEARGAWRELEAKLRPFVARRVASGADVDDVIQDIFFRLHRGRESLRDSERFGAWVYRIARHAIIDAARTRARGAILPRAAETITDTLETDLALPDDGTRLEADLGECVTLFVARLPSPYREAITLTELQNLSQKEAAEMLGISLSGMKSRVQRGRAKIREMFEACCRISLDCRGRVIACEPHNPSTPRDESSAELDRCGSKREG